MMMDGEEDDDDEDDADGDDDKQSWPTSTLSTSAKIQEINRVDDDVDHFILGNTKKSYKSNRFNDKATILSYWNHWNFCNVRMKFNRSKMSGLGGIGNI